jgi:phosphate transport system substrate-binding protein
MSGCPFSLSRRGLVPAAASVTILAMAACHSGPKTAPTAMQGSMQVEGAGSSFVYPLMTRWISDFQAVHQNVQINYQSIGSGGGIQQLKNGLTDFAASDAALDDQQLKTMPAVVWVVQDFVQYIIAQG